MASFEVPTAVDSGGSVITDATIPLSQLSSQPQPSAEGEAPHTPAAPLEATNDENKAVADEEDPMAEETGSGVHVAVSSPPAQQPAPSLFPRRMRGQVRNKLARSSEADAKTNIGDDDEEAEEDEGDEVSLGVNHLAKRIATDLSGGSGGRSRIGASPADVLGHVEGRGRPARLSPLSLSIRRVQQVDSVSEFAGVVADGPVAAVESLFLAAMLLLGAHFVLRRVAARWGVPEVLLFLFSGMGLRLLSDPLSAATFDIMAKPFVRMALTAMGLQIGSHLNKQVLAPLFGPLLRFSAVFIPTVLMVSSAVAAMLFPSLARCSWLVGSVALERSSPEALHGIAAAKSAGPFTNATMAISALQDIYALVAFVVFSAVVGSPLAAAVAHLMELAVGTTVSTCLTVVAVRAAVAVPMLAALFGPQQSGGGHGAEHASSDFGAGGGGAQEREWEGDAPGTGSATPATAALSIPSANTASNSNANSPPSTPLIKPETAAARSRRVLRLRALLAALVLVTPLLSWVVHTELLLAAVVAGAILNWDSPHRLTGALDAHSGVANIVLFCLLGHRISVLAYLQNLPAAFVLFAARLFGLWIGAMGGGHFGPLHQYPSSASGGGGGLRELLKRGGIAAALVGLLPSGARARLPRGWGAAALATGAPAAASASTSAPSAVLPSSVGASASVPPPSDAWHNTYRWMGLVTQLAIALSLVDRMEEQFPEAAPMARACGGSVIGALLVGPTLLQYVLRRVGEAGRGVAAVATPPPTQAPPAPVGRPARTGVAAGADMA